MWLITMNKDLLSHEILNILERLRIMHDLLREKNFSHISKQEIQSDLTTNLDLLNKHFEKLAQY
jgi:hypothetical protein